MENYDPLANQARRISMLFAPWFSRGKRIWGKEMGSTITRHSLYSIRLPEIRLPLVLQLLPLQGQSVATRAHVGCASYRFSNRVARSAIHSGTNRHSATHEYRFDLRGWLRYRLTDC